MKITPQIQSALRDLLEKHNFSIAELARRAGVSRASASYWLTGRTKNIQPRVWGQLEPMLRPYLDEAHTRMLFAAPQCPLADCPAKGIPHENLTNELLNEWASLSKFERLEALKVLHELRLKRSAASGG